MILDGQIQFVFNTPHGRSATGSPRRDGYEIRTAAILRDIPCITTVQGLAAAVQAIEAARDGDVSVRSLQAWGDEVTAALDHL
jgi:carbamoyl-phosphate synthase large subunit